MLLFAQKKSMNISNKALRVFEIATIFSVLLKNYIRYSAWTIFKLLDPGIL